jgi:hypothetical protein
MLSEQTRTPVTSAPVPTVNSSKRARRKAVGTTKETDGRPQEQQQPEKQTHLLHFPSFAHIEDQNLREGNELLQALMMLRARYGRHARVLDSAIEEIEDAVGPKPESSRDMVLRSLQSGCTTTSQMHCYLDEQLSVRRIREILLFFGEKNLVEIREIGPREGKTHNRELHYFLVH